MPGFPSQVIIKHVTTARGINERGEEPLTYARSQGLPCQQIYTHQTFDVHATPLLKKNDKAPESSPWAKKLHSHLISGKEYPPPPFNAQFQIQPVYQKQESQVGPQHR
jgi:hypothetical protein